MGFEGEWQSDGVQYNLGDVVEYQGKRYKIIQPHRSQADWPPTATPALWEHVVDHCRPVGEHQYGRQQDGGQCPTPSYDSYKHQPDQKPEDQCKPQPPSTYTTPGGAHVEPDQAKSRWGDLDDKKKKELEIGGALAGGLALLAGGAFYAHEKHKKDGEEATEQAWQLQNWLVSARQKTESFFSNGPTGPVTWLLSEALQQHPQLERDFIQGGEQNGEPWFIARAPHLNSIQIGKFKPGHKGALIGYAHDAILVHEFEFLVGQKSGIRWVPTHGKLDLDALDGARPVEGGHEGDGTPLFVAQAEVDHDGAKFIVPGKASPKLKGAFVTVGDTEKTVDHYKVLCFA